MERFIKDKKYLAILAKVLAKSETLPIGIYISAWILNILMKHFDEGIREEPTVTYYLRYMDDFVIFSKNKKKLHKLLPKLESMLADLGLTIKGNWQVFRVDERGVDIMGYRYYYNKVLMRKKNFKTFRRKSMRIEKAVLKYEDNTSVKRAASFLSVNGQIKHCYNRNMKSYTKKVDFENLKHIVSGKEIVQSTVLNIKHTITKIHKYNKKYHPSNKKKKRLDSPCST